MDKSPEVGSEPSNTPRSQSAVPPRYAPDISRRPYATRRPVQPPQPDDFSPSIESKSFQTPVQSHPETSSESLPPPTPQGATTQPQMQAALPDQPPTPVQPSQPQELTTSLANPSLQTSPPVQTDKQASQDLVSSPPKRHVSARTIRIVLAGIIITIICSLAAFFFLKQAHEKQTVANSAVASQANDYRSAVNGFIVAIQKRDKSAADALQSSAFTAELKQSSGSVSFYDNCYKAGDTCTNLFSQIQITTSIQKNAEYSGANAAGKGITYAETSRDGKTATTVGIYAVNDNAKWKIDSVTISDSKLLNGAAQNSAVVGGLTLEAQNKAQLALNNTKSKVDSFKTTKGYYPSDLLEVKADKLPDGAHYNFIAAPQGCLTAKKNCTSYVLSADSDADNASLYIKQSP